MSVRMRGPGGETVDVPDERVGYYQSQGFSPLSAEAEHQESVAEAAKPDDRGILGTINAGLSGAASGLTLGLSNLALGGLLNDSQRERLREDRAANPGVTTAGEVAGGLASSFAAPGSALARTPAGVLSRVANQGTEAARALGGVRGFAGQAAVTGAEAAAQNVGSYLGDVALGDRKLTAEGLGGALGTGFALGAAGGAAVYGIEKGSIAARNMFSRVMEGGEDATRKAAGEWERRSAEVFDANRVNIDEAKRRIDEAGAALGQARFAERRADQLLAEERVLGQTPRVVHDPVAEMAERIKAGQVPGEAGPFRDEQSLRLAAQRALARDRVRAELGGFDFAPNTGGALRDATKGQSLASAPRMRATEAMGDEAPIQIVGRADGALDDVLGGNVAARPAPYDVPTPTPARQVEPEWTAGPLDIDDYRTQQRALKQSLTREQKDSVLMYTDSFAYKDINDALRKGTSLDEELVKTVDDLDKMMKPTQQNMLLYREISAGKGQQHYASLKQGDEFQDLAFTSSSVDPKYLKNSPVHVIMEVPKGTMAAPVFAGPQTSYEMEMLLGRGMRARVISSTTSPVKAGDKTIDRTVLRVRIEPNQGPPGALPSVRTPQTFRAADAPAGGWAPIDDALRSRYSALEMDPYAKAVQFANETGEASIASLRSIGIGPASAQGAVRRMEREGLILAGPEGEAGVYRLAAPEIPTAPNASTRSGAPDGFDVAAKSDGQPVFVGTPTVREGLPSPGEVDQGTFRKQGFIVRPSDLVSRQVSGIESGADMVTAPRTANVRKAWAGGGRVPAIEIDMTPSGRYVVADGNHRLVAAALDGDRPVLARVRPVEYEIPNADRIDTVLQRALGSRAPQPAVPPQVQQLAATVAEAEDASTSLMRALQGTKSQIDQGATIAQVGATNRAQPLSRQQLQQQYDDIYERAAEATDPAMRQALYREADAIEEQLARAPQSLDAMSEIDSVTQAMQRYEKAMADLADELGDAAHPASRASADALREAQTAAERRMVHRAAQAIDDHADGGGFAKVREEAAKEGVKGADVSGPAEMPAKERIAYARARQGEARAATAKARTERTAAQQTYDAEVAKGAATNRAAETIGLQVASGAKGGQAGAGRAADLGTVLELAGMVGIPGLPKPSDLPIVGPVLGLYLKARALKAGADRLMGRVPASGNAKVAALAAQTKDKAARVVDRMLGHVERGAPKLRTAVAVAGPKLLDAVRDRIHDDGSPAPAKDAGLQEHVAARSREIGALAANPMLIAQQVRRSMRDVADPDMVQAAIDFRTAQVSYLDKESPKEPPPSPFQRTPWRPDKQTATDFARKYAVAMDPLVALEQVEQKCLTPEAAEAFRAVYPLLYQQTQDRLLAKAIELKTTLPRQQLTRMSILFDIPLDSALEPANLSRVQAAFRSTSPAEPTQQQGPPSPSIAGSTNLTALYQTASDRRAAAR